MVTYRLFTLESPQTCFRLMSNTKLQAQQFQSALNLHQQGQLAQAIEGYRSLLAESPNYAAGWHHLAMACHQSKQLAAAKQAISQAIALNANNAQYWLLAGNVAQDAGDFQTATHHFLYATQLEPTSPQAFNNLGITYRDINDAENAKSAFTRAVELKPDYARALNNLAALLVEEGDSKRAIALLKRAVAADPQYPHARRALVSALLMEQQYSAALEVAQQLVQLAPNWSEAWLVAGNAFQSLQQVDQALECFQKGIALAPSDPTLLQAMAIEAGRAGNVALAEATYTQLALVAPKQLRSLISRQLLLPQIYTSSNDLEQARERYEHGLSAIESHDIDYTQPVKDILLATSRSNFFLAYQGRNDIGLQARFANWQSSVISKLYPTLYQSIPPQAKNINKKIRVGFVSAFLHASTAGYYFQHWMTDLPSDQFEVFVWEIDGNGRRDDDPVRNHIRNHVNSKDNGDGNHYFLDVFSADKVANQIKTAQLDALIYPELGMHPDVYMLASMRLAPLQCMAWGHPVTSGHANIDVAFSAESMEPNYDIAQSHYREKLALLPGIGTRYRHAGIPSQIKPREAFELPTKGDAVLALYPQSLFKLHPDNDALVVRLLKQEPNVVLVMFQGQSTDLTQAYTTRLAKQFQAQGVAPQGRIKLLPTMDHIDYLSVCLHCDFMLDTLHWSGGNTSLDAIACGLPIVTMPGEFMRARQSAAMLRLMELDKLVAQDEADYLRIAGKLVRDTSWRKSMAEKVSTNQHKILNDSKPITALANWLCANA